VGEGLALGLGLGDGVPGGRPSLDGLARVGDGLARCWCAGVCCMGVAVGDGVAGGKSAPPDPVVVEAGATSR
jgi:hypothetical protein